MKMRETSISPQKEIINIIKKINTAWTKGRIEDFREFFHRDITIASPDFQNRLRGIVEVQKSYKDYYDNSKTLSFSESDFHIEIFDKTAAADYEYHIIYEINNKKYDGTGREIWIFINVNNKWLAVWRCMTNVVDKEVS